VNRGAADEFGVEPEKVQATLVAIAPVVGTARVAEAALATRPLSVFRSRSKV
jgi:4-carboxymuconolactone decarboxylase